MTTREFIYKALKGETRKEFCSSVVVYGDTVYSYGTHYPLAKIIKGVGFVNDAGYSMTTSKHINWAFGALSDLVGWDNVYHAPLGKGGGLNLKDIESSAKTENERLVSLMAAKKRKDTKAYEWLQSQNERMRDTLTIVKELKGRA